jgi:LysR family transcriptional regulator, regulator for bpeEF and oprC
MTLDEMRAFLKVAELGSFTKAAEALNSHTSRISALVKDLETSLGQDLLVRSTRALRLTDFGEDTLQHVTTILSAVDELVQSAGQDASGTSGHLRITAAADYGLVQGFALANPNVRLTVTHETANADLISRDCDIALRLGPLKDSNLKSQRLGFLHFGLFASPTYLKQRGRPTSPDDLDGHDWLRLSLRPYRPLAFKWRGKDITIAAEPRAAFSDVASLRDAALQGLGIARLALPVAAPWIANKHLEHILVDAAFDTAPLYAVHPGRKSASPLIKSFTAYAAKALGQAGSN